MPKPEPEPGDNTEKKILEQLEKLVQELGYLDEIACRLQTYFTGECKHQYTLPEPDAVPE